MSSAILFISAVPTHPTNAGNRIRILRLTKLLEEAGWEVHFALIGSNPSFYAPMRQYWGERLRYLAPSQRNTRLVSRLLRTARRWLKVDQFGRLVLHGGRHEVDEEFTPEVEQFVRDLARLERYQAVVAEYVTMSRALAFFGPATRKFIDTHDVFTDRNRKFAGQKVSGSDIFALSSRGEAKGLARADAVIAIQENEKRFFETIYPGKVAVVGHLVDIRPAAAPAGGKPTLLFVGSRHEANLIGIRYFAREILPFIRERVAQVNVLIAGRICERLEPLDGCTKMGEVGDLTPLYNQAHVIINPVTVGTGLKIKNMDALGRGKPLVTTSIGAEGIELGVGKAFLVGDTPREFADGVISFLLNEEKRQLFLAEALNFARLYNQNVRQELLALFK